ncbi:fungal-specific transcription factor domain-containing protein, partial [Crepidotus variabilis]
MSSAEDDHFDGEGISGRSHGAKKRKIQRACDICRRKKSDGGQMPDNKCSNCIACAFDCTYVEAAKKRGPTKGYVEGLEIKVDKMEKLIRQLCPDESTFKSVMATVESKSPVVDYEPLYPSSMMGTSNSDNQPKPTAPTILDSLAHAIRNVPQDRDSFPEDEDDKAAYMLSERVKTMRIEPSDYRFFGKSSGAVLIQRAIEARSNFIGTDTQHFFNPIVSGFRPKFWTLKEWERKPHIIAPSTPLDFPEHGLIMDLVALYFKHINLFMPLFHRPTLERAIQDGLHLNDTSFALVVLLICAVGSRFSDDPRTRLEVDEPHSAGWKWFHQAITVQKTFVTPHSLHDLQYYPLAAQFLAASAVPQSCWSLIGIGLRVAQDIGAHRRGLPKLPSVEEELKKRAFWILIVLDRMFGAALGRPCGIKDEDFDLDLPIDCDDEYWDNEDPHQRFIQPKGKPSKIAAFISMIKLTQILSVTLRTIYAINKSKVLFGFAGMKWEQVVIAELDSALNVWIDALPSHLIWDPNREDDDFFNQSLALYANYYHTQIIVHRPFIPTSKRPSSVPFPSLAICTSAARSCSHLVDLRKAKKSIPAVMIHGPVCTAALVLLLNLWSSKRTGLAQETVKKDMEDVYNCMEVLKLSEERYHTTGRLWDVLRHLADAGEFPLPESNSQPSKKRARGADFTGTVDESHDEALNKQSSRPRNIAGSLRASKEKPRPPP